MFASAASCTQSCSVFSYIQSLKGIFSRGPFLTHLCFCDKENKVICWPWKQQFTKYCHHKSPEQMFVITVRLRSLIWVLFWPLGSSGDILWKQKNILWWPFKLIWWASVRILASFGMSQLWVITFLIKMSFQFQSLNSKAVTAILALMAVLAAMAVLAVLAVLAVSAVLAVIAASEIQMFQRSFTDFFEKRVYSWGQSKLN